MGHTCATRNKLFANTKLRLNETVR